MNMPIIAIIPGETFDVARSITGCGTTERFGANQTAMRSRRSHSAPSKVQLQQPGINGSASHG